MQYFYEKKNIEPLDCLLDIATSNLTEFTVKNITITNALNKKNSKYDLNYLKI